MYRVGLIPSVPSVKWNLVRPCIHLFFFICSGWRLRISEATGPGFMTICPPDSENTLPEPAACDVEIHKRGAAFALVTEHLGAANTCQMSAHLLPVSLLAYPSSGWLFHPHSPGSPENAP